MVQIAPIEGLAHVIGDTSRRLLDVTLPEFFDYTLRKYGHCEAVVFSQFGIRWTYAELLKKCDDFAAGLLSLGIYKGDRVGIWSPNRAEWIIAQIATARIGAILVNINPAYKATELEYCVNKVGLKCLIFATQFKSSGYAQILKELCPDLDGQKPGYLRLGKMKSLRILVQISNSPISGAFSFAQVLKKGTSGYRSRLDHISSNLQPDDAINIQFTSGTTGAPKGATLSHKNIINNAISCAKAMKLTQYDRLCIPVPLYHCFGMVLGTLACCSAGAAMIFPSEGFDADTTVRTLKDEACTAVHGVPTMFSAMLSSSEFKGRPIKSLRTGIMAGSQCPETLMRRVLYDLGCSEITIGYGMTETSPISFQSDVNDTVNVRVSTVGRIQPHCEVKIVDDDGNTCAIGETGEFWARGYLVMKGYWQDEAATKASIEAGWMKSGDLATIDAQGYCRIVGRKKDMVIRGGENIYPAELENFLTSQKGISEAHVFGIPDEKFGEQLVAWIIAEKGAQLDEASIKELCRKSLAYYKVPAIVRFVENVPLTATGKPQKFRMVEMMMAEKGGKVINSSHPISYQEQNFDQTLGSSTPSSTMPAAIASSFAEIKSTVV